MTHNIASGDNGLYCTYCGVTTFNATCLFNKEFQIKESEVAIKKRELEIKERVVDETRNKFHSELAIKERELDETRNKFQSELAIKERELDETKNKFHSELAIKEKELTVKNNGVYSQFVVSCILIAVLVLGYLMYGGLLYILYYGMDNIKEKMGEIVTR